MAEPQTLSVDMQATLASILVNIQKAQEDATKQNKSLHDENKRIFMAIHDQAKQSKQLLESTEKSIGEKVELIRNNIETALEANNSRNSECEAKMSRIEERVVHLTSTVSELVAEQDQRIQELRQQLIRLQSTSTPANQTTYISVSYTHLDVYKRQLYNGPYSLSEQVGKNTYIVTNPNPNCVIGKFHASSLRKYYVKDNCT